jgi:hypothetical protein
MSANNRSGMPDLPPLATDLVCDEFTCRECGRLIFAFPRGWVAWFGELCATCQWLPGWHLDPQLRKRLDPDME